MTHLEKTAGVLRLLRPLLNVAKPPFRANRHIRNPQFNNAKRIGHSANAATLYPSGARGYKSYLSEFARHGPGGRPMTYPQWSGDQAAQMMRHIEAVSNTRLTQPTI